MSEGCPPHRHLRSKLAVLFFSIVISLAVLEIGLRLFHPAISPAQDAALLGYGYDAELGWFPSPNSRKLIKASRTITAINNSDGLRAPERVTNNKPVVVFLGDSLVWGFDVDASERFTEKLQSQHPEWAIYNFGVSGYGNDQEYLLLQKYFARYRPRLVVTIICADNDNEDNAWNFRGGYYKPWFKLEAGSLKLHGVPVPKSAKSFFAEHTVLSHSFVLRLLVSFYYRLKAPAPVKNGDPPTGVILLEMRKYVLERGALFAVGLQRSNSELEDFLRKFQIPYVDLTTTNPLHTYPRFGNHWTPEGHNLVAVKINDFLTAIEKKRAPN